MADENGTPTGGTPAPAQGTPAPAGGAPAQGDNPAGTTAGAAPAGDSAQGGNPAGTPAGATNEWPADWRQMYAKDDPKALKRLERYASPKAAIDALFAAQNKISSGELRAPLKADATPEEVKQWRADNGIPETPEGYELKLKAGSEVGEYDKPLVDQFLKVAHESNMSPDVVSGVVQWYLDTQANGEQALQQRDREDELKLHTELRAEMGADYKVNLQVATELIPQDLKEDFLAARLPDGTALGNDPRVIAMLAGLARQVNPIGAVMPGSGENASQAVTSELANLKKLMGDRTSEYWKGPKSGMLQARYRDLVSAQQRAGAR